MGSDSSFGQVPLSNIHIYSTKQSKWFTQSLDSSATVPPPRFAFCTALKSAPDGSSHQIYMFSGLEATPGIAYNKAPTAKSSEVWVLTIPTFEWIKLDWSGSTTGDPVGRIAPSCVTIGEHYALSYGGRKSECDDKGNAALLYDLNTLTWTDQFEPNRGTYKVPQKVYEMVGGK